MASERIPDAGAGPGGGVPLNALGGSAYGGPVSGGLGGGLGAAGATLSADSSLPQAAGGVSADAARAPPAQLDRFTVLLQDGKTQATIYPILRGARLPTGLLLFLCDELNIEIERGRSLPLYDMLDLASFQHYWFGAAAGIMLLGDPPRMEDRRRSWEKECLGTFYMKPAYPGRSSQICTGEFLVNAGIRGKGIGKTMMDCFCEWAPKLGYTGCLLQPVYDTNTAARRVCEAADFTRQGRIRGAGLLRDLDTPVDAWIYFRTFLPDPELSECGDADVRFARLKYFLETGKYPADSDKAEKSRLRASSVNYTLEDGKLMLKGREVVWDTKRQLDIVTKAHNEHHYGVNRTTTAVAERYHWTRIKEIVAHVVRTCQKCGDELRAPKRPRPENGEVPEPLGGLEAGDDKLSPPASGAAQPPTRNSVAGAAGRGQQGHLGHQHGQHHAHHASHGHGHGHPLAHPSNLSAGELLSPALRFADADGDEEISIARALIQANETTDPKYFD